MKDFTDDITDNSHHQYTATGTRTPAMIDTMPQNIDPEELKQKLEEQTPLHFVFAYGSLICKKSRAITAPTLADKEAIPVQVSDVERIWAKRTKRGMTAMGVRFRQGAKCTGVLLPVTESELARFDEREMGYDRYQIPLDQVDEVPFLAKKNHYEEKDYEHAEIVFGDDNASNSNKSDNSTTKEDDKPSSNDGVTEHQVFVWIYVQRYDCPADEEFPIAQSYVDIILRGCMGISKEFARSFIDTTKGWSPEEVYGEGDPDDNIDDSDDEDEDGEEEERRKAYCSSAGTSSVENDDNGNNGSDDGAHWVDDRKDPIYMRADPVYSEKKGDAIDQLLEEHIPDHLDNREEVTDEGEKTAEQ